MERRKQIKLRLVLIIVILASLGRRLILWSRSEVNSKDILNTSDRVVIASSTIGIVIQRGAGVLTHSENWNTMLSITVTAEIETPLTLN